MKTLEQIKDEISVERGYYDWQELIYSGHCTIINIAVNELLILVQKECLNNAQRNLNIQEYGKDKAVDFGITNENNIIK